MEEPATSNTGHTIRIREQGSALIAELVGVIDISVARALHVECLGLAEAGRDIVIGLQAAERLDASALQVLLALRQEVTRRGRSFSIAGDGTQIRNYLEMAGVPGLLTGGDAQSEPRPACVPEVKG